MSEDSSSNNTGNSLFSIDFTPQMLILSAVGLLALILVCIFGVLLLDPLDRVGRDTADTEVVDLPDDEGSLGREIDRNSIIIFDGNSSLSIDVDPPTNLVLGGTSIPAKAQFVTEAGNWSPEIEEGRLAEWVYGTVVNPVFGLSGTAENELLMQKLVPGDAVAINYASGESREYLVSGRQLVASSDTSLFSQNRPGLTLIWLGESGDDSRLVVYGDYKLPEETSDEVASARPAGVGEPVTLGNISLTVTDARQDFGNTIAPPGFSIFLVDFLVKNNGASPVDSGLIRISLQDQQGNQYATNAAANTNGSHANLVGFINSGDERAATAAFQIPTSLSGDSLEWNVSRIDVPGNVAVSISYGGGGPVVASVGLTSADVSPEGAALVVSGSITNGGTQPFQVAPTDVSLRDGGTVYLVFSTTPGFPWNVPPGQSVNFSLSFQRPQGGSATFSLLNNSFELSGIR